MSQPNQPEKLNPQVLDALQATQKMTIIPEIVSQEGQGKTYLSASQTVAIVIQDAADNLRNLSTISSTAIGVALAKCLVDPERSTLYAKAITQAQNVTKSAAADFKTLGTNAADILDSFQKTTSK